MLGRMWDNNTTYYSGSLNQWNGEIVSYIHLPQDGGRWVAFVKKIMQLQVT